MNEDDWRTFRSLSYGSNAVLVPFEVLRNASEDQQRRLAEILREIREEWIKLGRKRD